MPRQPTVQDERRSPEMSLGGGRTNGRNNVEEEVCSRGSISSPAMLIPPSKPDIETRPQRNSRLAMEQLNSPCFSAPWLKLTPKRPQRF